MFKITGADDIPESEDVLANDGLSEEDRKLFSNARPRRYEPYPIKAIEDFANWARANSLWILGFGTGCGAIELRFPGLQAAASRRLFTVLVAALHAVFLGVARI